MPDTSNIFQPSESSMLAQCICRLPVCSCVQDTPVLQQEMMQACETGNVLKLQNLFDAAGVTIRDHATQRTVDPIYRSGPSAIYDMVHKAVTHNRPAILKLLFEIYPSFCISHDALLGSTCANPDLPTFKVLHAHDPSIVNYELDEKGLETLLMDYCRSGDPRLPEYLLDNGADPDWSGPPGIQSPLSAAITSDQPPSLISKIIRCGAEVRTIDVAYAMRQQRTDITALLLSGCQWEAYGTAREVNLKNALQDAHETRNEEIISIMEKYMKNEKTSEKYWWQIWKWRRG